MGLFNYSYNGDKDVILECVNKWLKLVPNVEQMMGNEILSSLIPVQSNVRCHEDALKTSEMLKKIAREHS